MSNHDQIALYKSTFSGQFRATAAVIRAQGLTPFGTVDIHPPGKPNCTAITLHTGEQVARALDVANAINSAMEAHDPVPAAPYTFEVNLNDGWGDLFEPGARLVIGWEWDGDENEHTARSSLIFVRAYAGDGSVIPLTSHIETRLMGSEYVRHFLDQSEVDARGADRERAQAAE